MSIVEYAVADDVATVTLNRPQRLNAETPELVEALVARLGEAREAGVAAIVLTGSGRAFCAGHDLREPTPPGHPRARLERIQDVTRAIRGFPGVVIAAVHGYALGAGAEFAFGCDLVVAATGTEFGFPEVSVGLSVTGGISALLPRAVGPVRAKGLVLLGERFSAEQALAWGLVNRVSAAGEHVAVATELARRCRDLPPVARSLAKAALDAGGDATVAAALSREVDDAFATLRSGEFQPREPS